MNKLAQMRTKREWLILALALIVPLLGLSFTALDEGLQYAGLELTEALAGLGAVCLMLLAWKSRKTSLTKAVLLGSASTLLVLASDYYPDEDRFLAFLIVMLPLCLSGLMRLLMKKRTQEQAILICCVASLPIVAAFCLVWSTMTWTDMSDLWPRLLVLLIETAVWSLLVDRTYASGEERSAKLWRAWLLCALLCCWILGESKLEGMLTLSCWYDLYWYAQPLLYALLLRFLKKRGVRPAGLIYFALCLLVYRLNLSGTHCGPSGDIFFLLMPLIVYTGETRRDGKPLQRHLLRLGYTLLCCGLTYLNSERLRMVIYDLGGPAIDIPNGPRVDWIAYRLAGLKSYFAGNVEAFDALTGFRDFENYENYVYYGGFGAQTYRHGWWWFLVLVLAVVAVSVLLLRMKWPDPALNRSKNYLALSYLLRAAIYVPGVLFMYIISGVDFPFSPYQLMDLLLLWMLFEKQKATEPQPGGGGAA